MGLLKFLKTRTASLIFAVLVLVFSWFYFDHIDDLVVIHLCVATSVVIDHYRRKKEK